MTERPMIFTADSVRAIGDGRKTQTRRVMKTQPEHIIKHRENIAVVDGRKIYCPYGQPGDRLWVRETWYQIHNKDFTTGQVIYKADGWESEDKKPLGWRSPMFMPRWASRILLEIVSIRVERVQEISIDDIFAEGSPRMSSDEDGSELYEWYSDLWDSLNAKRYPWESNPWVWAIEFRRVQP